MNSYRFISDTGAKLLKVSLAAILSFSGLSSTILAEEETEQPEEIVSEEVSEEVEEEETAEELPEDTEEITEEAGSEEGMIIREAEGIGFDAIRTDTRPELEELLSKLPETIRVRIAEDEASEGTWAEIPANWECADDYSL